ncbi:hypothetical protein TRVA0_026S00782 [Trichomonascus vanleenenianus]|uniref:Scy1p n=1 Tax=Trichomonascus vanleenenianus TaxID=2268995 RepID=UPI003EC99E53
MLSAFKAFSSGILANYSISKNVQFRAGPWSVYSGKRKSSGEAVSIFMFDKKALQHAIAASGIDRSSVNDVYDRLKREANALAKIRHPSIVKIIEPLEDGRSSMMFVTEPLSACLKGLIDRSGGGGGINDGDLDELVIQKGLLQITEGLQFLHNNANLVHLDIQPSSILIDAKGDWKLGGLGFIQNYKEQSNDFFISQYDPRLPGFIQINLDFSAPELVLDRRLEPGNDVFSLGCLIICIYIQRPPFRTNNNPSTYKSELASISRILRDQKIPQYLSGILPRLITRNAIERITLEDLKHSEFFDNPLIRTINFLNDFPAKLLSEKKTFLNGLQSILPQFPKSVLQRKILQSLIEDIEKEPNILYLILQNVFAIGKDMSQLGFTEKILPALAKVKNEFGCQLAIHDNLEVLTSRLSDNEFTESILPIVINMLATAPAENQASLLTKINIIASKLDFITMKNEVFPVIGTVFGKTTSLSVKLEAVKAFRVLIELKTLDKFAVTEKLLPLLSAMKTREPKILLASLDVYTLIADMVDIDVAAKTLIPNLLTLSMESLLTKQQFHGFMNRIKSVLDRIEREHERKLSSQTASQDDLDILRNGVVGRDDKANSSSPNSPNFNSLISGTVNNSAPRNNSLEYFSTSASPTATSFNASTTTNTGRFGSAGSAGSSAVTSFGSVGNAPSALKLERSSSSSKLFNQMTPLTPKPLNASSSVSRNIQPTTSTSISRTIQPTTTSTGSIDWSKAVNNSLSQPIQNTQPSKSALTIPALPKPLTPQSKRPTSQDSGGSGLDKYQSLL